MPIRMLASRNDVPKRFLEHIMIEMREQGWVKSSAGREGGYLLANRPGTVHHECEVTGNFWNPGRSPGLMA